MEKDRLGKEGHPEESEGERFPPPAPWLQAQGVCEALCASDPGEAERLIHMVEGKRADGQTGSRGPEP